jgi:hypothetical protein
VHIDIVQVLLSILGLRDEIFVSLILLCPLGDLSSNPRLSFSLLLETGTKVLKVLLTETEAVLHLFFSLIRLE